MADDLRKCQICHRRLPGSAYGTISDSSCSECVGIAMAAIGVVRQAKKRVYENVMADCEDKRKSNCKAPTKFCNNCKTTKSAGEFYASHEPNRRTGLQSWCKACQKAKNARIYAKRNTEDPEYYRRNAREYKRAKSHGLPVQEALRRFRMSYNELVLAVKDGSVQTRCVKGQRVFLRVDTDAREK